MKFLRNISEKLDIDHGRSEIDHKNLNQLMFP